jgi:hypothetical protein
VRHSSARRPWYARAGAVIESIAELTARRRRKPGNLQPHKARLGIQLLEERVVLSGKYGSPVALVAEEPGCTSLFDIIGAGCVPNYHPGFYIPADPQAEAADPGFNLGGGLDFGGGSIPAGREFTDPCDDANAGVPNSYSDGPVRYFDGVAHFAVTDIVSGAFGQPWSQTRSWSNGYAPNSVNGNGWVDTQLPTLVQVDRTVTLAVVVNGTNAYYFDDAGSTGTYVERFFGHNSLTYTSSSDQYTLTTEAGVQYKFAGFSTNPAGIRGPTAAKHSQCPMCARSPGISATRPDN